MRKLIFCVILVQGFSSGYPDNNVEEVFKWKKVEFENLPQSENSYVGPYKYYIPENNDVMGFGYHPASGLMLITVSRLRPGVPSSLAAFCVNDYKWGSSPKLWGFPNYGVNALRDSDFTKDNEEYEGRRSWKPSNNQPSSPNDLRFISVYHVHVDEKCNRVFFIDNGILSYYGKETFIIQNPALVEISLPSDSCETRNFPVNRRAEFPRKISEKVPFGVMFITLDYQSDSCDDLFIYITNIYANYLAVYDYKKNDFWVFTDHPTFLPVAAESHSVFNQTLFYDNPLGIVSIALGYPDDNGDRTAYYIAGASTAQFAVSTKILKNQKKSPRNYKPEDFKIIGHRGCDTAVKMAIDYTTGVIFYTEMNSYKISCWNINKPLNPDNVGVIYESQEKLKYPLQIFVDSIGDLWFNSNYFPVIYETDPLNLNEVHSRIFRVRASDVIRGTVCEW